MERPEHKPRCRLPLLALLAALAVVVTPEGGATTAQAAPPYPQARQFFPEADGFGPFEGRPPAAAVYRQGRVIGHLVRTADVAPIPAYSGKPVNLLVGFDTAGKIRGAHVLEHHEPILLVGIPESRLQGFAAQFAGKRITDRVRIGGGSQGEVAVDGVSGATVTVMVVARTIMKSVRRVAQARGLLRGGAGAPRAHARVRRDLYRKATWRDLVAEGAFGHLRLTSAQVDEALRKLGARLDPPPGGPDETFIDLWFALVDPPVVGRNLLGDEQYRWLMEQLQPGEHVVAVLANGRYSFKGSGYVRGGIFDRVQLTQGGQTILFRDLDHHRLADVYLEGMPAFSEMALFIVRAGYEFDPGRPYRLELLVRQQTGPTDSVFTTFAAGHRVPEPYLERPPAATGVEAAAEGEDQPMWAAVWKRRWTEVAVLVAGLLFLTVVLLLQDVLARRRRLLLRLRTGFLIFTLLFIGWYALGQLSIVNVFTFLGSLMRGFRWETFLMDPILFVLWTYVAAAVLLWGRGVFCGWLCPFGALQKLLNEAARRLRVPQLVLPALVHERLLALKYVILLVLFGISLQSLGTAERYAEIEPFKTAILLRFDREWPYVLYALALLTVAVFISKFYCKYLCPLGAALALPTRLRVFDWLKRRKECGRPCQICANACEIQAIRPTGEIDAHECHYCMDCQVIYWDDKICPPLVARRRRRERAAGARRAAERMVAALRSAGPDGGAVARAAGSNSGAERAEPEGR